MRVLVIAHGHPMFSKGGGELAAYYLYQELNRVDGHEAWFVGRAGDELLHLGSPLAMINDREILISGHADIHNLHATVEIGPESDFAALLRRIDPDVIHFHHYYLLGIEMILAVKRICPGVKVVVTFHEYMAICLNNGQMVKTDGRLCYQYSPRECSQCFRGMTPEDFFLREKYLKTFFRLVDRFVSPSNFLLQRYLDWGLDRERIVVIENGLPLGERLPPRELAAGDVRGRFAYFGQINPFKGVDLILDAFTQLPNRLRMQVSLDIYGSALENQERDFQDKIYNLLKKNKKNFFLHGPYEAEELSQLMAGIDWVVMGSIWWENSPLVIQEAFKFGRPVICPDIGGMVEKVRHGKGGLNYRARDSASLADSIRKAIETPDLYEHLQNSLPEYSAVYRIAGDHVMLYAQL